MTNLIRVIASTMLFVVAACGGDSNTATNDETVVNVYNWADYIAPGVVEQFESETGIDVNYDTYASSSTIDVKLLTGNSGYYKPNKPYGIILICLYD